MSVKTVNKTNEERRKKLFMPKIKLFILGYTYKYGLNRF
jgi:hypothetical protein